MERLHHQLHFPGMSNPTSESRRTRQPISLGFIYKCPNYTTPPSSSHPSLPTHTAYMPTDECEHQASLTQSPVFPSTPRHLYQPTGIVISPVMPPTVSAAAADAIADTYKHAYHPQQQRHSIRPTLPRRRNSIVHVVSPRCRRLQPHQIPCNIHYLQGSNQPTTAIPQSHPPAQYTISLYLSSDKTGSACRR